MDQSFDTYWNTPAAADKTFTAIVRLDWLIRYWAYPARILDVGCGYGRTLAELQAAGFTRLLGIDPSAQYVERAHREHPELDVRCQATPGVLDFDAASFDGVILAGILTCVAGDTAQRALLTEITRVLRPGGMLYLSDFLLGDDERNQARYRRFVARYGTFGIFELPEGAVLRHHTPEHLEKLLGEYEILESARADAPTMNHHTIPCGMYLARKPGVVSDHADSLPGI